MESGTVLKALETAIPSEAIEQAIADTNSNEERKRALPSHLVVCLIIASNSSSGSRRLLYGFCCARSSGGTSAKVSILTPVRG